MSGFTLELAQNDITLDLSPSPAIVLELGLSVPIVQNVSSGGGGGNVSDNFTLDFADSSLSVAGILVVTHGLNATPSAVTIYDASGEWIYPDKIESLTPTMAAVNLESFRPLQGNWRIVVNG
jgi:hypothetical protein